MSSLCIPVLAASTPSNFSIGGTLGAMYIGATIAAVFYGITILQTAIYYKLNPNDPWIFRYMVALLWVLDTLHVALSAHALYFYLIESFGNYHTLFKIIWSFRLQFVINVRLRVSFSDPWLTIVGATYPGSTDYMPSESGNVFGRHFHVVLPWFIFLFVAATFGSGLYVIYDTYTLSSFVQCVTLKIDIP
ncbi:uncharacterized protein EV420DRAFT_1644036 [Desarmillaria tabescens]|uniref:Uncharacterized protein n=1 Tax=Armillaria tabescens TaxID=1929756 RepID=A0AA39KCE9_ARMTA|nr:uncharacterized protein EV420DRAFT_1644036 [Desarmillaria tabescens]KAK0457286.1 hypothetical protein EV420DRAFT_1644036 [Desarmillaria tabescens]